MFTYPVGFMSGGKKPPEITYRGFYGGLASGSSRTFTGIPIGDPSPNRLVVVFTQGWHDGGASLSSLTIGGVSGTVQAVNYIPWVPTAAGSAIVPTGNTADITVNFNTYLSGIMAHVYTIEGAESNTPVLNLSKITNPLEVLANPPKDTAVVAFGSHYQPNVIWNWSGELGIQKDGQGYVADYLATLTGSLVTVNNEQGTIRANHYGGFNSGSIIVLGFQ